MQWPTRSYLKYGLFSALLSGAIAAGGQTFPRDGQVDVAVNQVGFATEASEG